jgi:hypothetical protein
MKSFKWLGIVDIVGGAGCLVVGILVPPFLPIGIILAVTFIGIGVLFLYLHPGMKKVKIPGGGTLGGGMRAAAEGTEFAARNLKQMATTATVTANGKPARATIVSFRETGEVIGFNPVIEFELTVFPQDGRPPYPATVRQPLSKLTRMRLMAGDQVAATVDPAHPHEVLLAL